MDIDYSKRKNLYQCIIDHFGRYQNFSIDDYIHAFGKSRDALLYFTLFFPEFIEIESLIFLRRNIVTIEEVREKIRARKKSSSEIQKAYNFIETGYLFGGEGRDTSNEEDELLSIFIQYAWGCHLNRLYPHKKFNVEVVSPQETGSTIGVLFYE